MKKICKMITYYYDGELSEKEAEIFKAHLEKCENCSKKIKDYSSISNLIRVTTEKLDPESEEIIWDNVEKILIRNDIKEAVENNYNFLIPVIAAVAVILILVLPFNFKTKTTGKELFADEIKITNLKSNGNVFIYKKNKYVLLWISKDEV